MKFQIIVLVEKSDREDEDYPGHESVAEEFMKNPMTFMREWDGPKHEAYELLRVKNDLA